MAYEFAIYIKTCPVWSIWSQWTLCSVSCGGGIQSHRRICVTVDGIAQGCLGSASEFRICNIQV